ncbi:DHH phosphoesterase [Hypomontagnella monticulosa]|nr:DHH phosphoesterase [Hypomontagnella monticulosa]
MVIRWLDGNSAGTDGTESNISNMPPQKSLQAFLATARAALTAPQSKRQTPLHFVVGNESADLDSLCSTLFLAYFRSNTPPHTLHIPLCHLPRNDLTLRPEFAAVLGYAGATTDDVVTLSEMPSLPPEDTRWLLVDHNVMTGTLGQAYGDRVFGCIDHHDDERKLPSDADPRVVEKCGSCMSLVVEYCRDAWDALARHEGSKRTNAQLGYLALAPVLIDTNNLRNKAKTTPRDERVVSIAEARVLASPDSGYGDGDGYERVTFFEKVAALKEDISFMSPRDILRKDYKEWNVGATENLKLGTSSAPRDFKFLAHKAGGEEALARSLEEWGQEKGIDVLAVLTASKDHGGFRRELLVWARTGPGVVSALKEWVEGEGREKLGLDTWEHGKLDVEDGEKSWRRCWTQARIENSRKQIAPMLRDALKTAKA